MASGQKKKTTTKKTAPQKSALPPIRREVGGGVCLLLALCVVVSYFQADAIVLNLLGNLLKGLAGYGYWLAAPALALAGVNLLAHRGRPVVLRTVCALVLPVLLGAILHLFLYRGEAVTGLAPAMKGLWASGLLLQSGGARVVLECARFYMSLISKRILSDTYDLLDVMGPDEYLSLIHI